MAQDANIEDPDAHQELRRQASDALELANARLASREWDEVLEAAEEAQRLCASLREQQDEAVAFHVLSLAKFRLEDFDGGAEGMRRACSLYQDSGVSKSEALERICLADCLLRFRPADKDGKVILDEAMMEAETALHIFERLEDVKGKSMAADRMVRIWLGRGDALQAREVAEQALQVARGKEEKVAEAAMLQSLAVVHAATKTTDAAVQSAKDAAAVLEAIEDYAAQAGSLHLAAQLYLKATPPNPAAAVECAQSARRVHQSCTVSTDDEATILQTLSAAHLANGAATKALEAACAGRDLCKEAEAAAGEARCLLRAASAFVQLGDLEAALSSASDAQELFREANDPRAEASAAHVVARLQLQRKDFSAARIAADTARALLRQTSEIGREVGMLLLSSQAGSLELGAGAQPGGGKAARNFFEGRGRQKVLAASKEAVALSRRLGSKHLLAISRLVEARAKVSSGNLDEAAADLQEAMEPLQEAGDERALGAAKLLKANISILNGDPDLATAKEALECLRAFADAPHAQALVSKMQMRSAAPRASQPKATAPPQPVAQANTASVAPRPATIDKMSLALPERVKYTLTELVAEAIGQEGMEEDRTLMETGMTSIASIMLRDRIQAEFPEIPEMDLTFVFDYPTIREMTGFVLQQLPDA
mmetsp:Transcript_6100/g.11164  ORF Transcript_6100/g.11164 Transcript_6100/m.11164 type:complete len:657 (+) Transcript_6100:27-1997(+)